MDTYFAFILLECMLAAGIIGMNLLVCATVYLHKELRSITNYLIVCLAVADFGVGALAIPFSIVLSMEYTLCFYVCLFLTCFPLVTTQFSILLLLVIAINAHLKIRLPNSYAIYVNKRRITFIVAFCWLLSCLIGFSPMMGWNGFQQYVDSNRSVAISIPSERSVSVLGHGLPYAGFLSKVYFSIKGSFNNSDIHGTHLGRCTFTSIFTPEYLVYFIFFTCTLLPLGIMLSIYIDLFRIVRGHFMAHPLRVTKWGEVQLAHTLLLLVGIFCVCWIPINVINSLGLLCPGCTIYKSLIRLTVLLSHVNSLANPLVYALRKKDFGLALRSVFFRYVLCWPILKSCRRKSKVYPKA
ncbi:adenosine receptor A2b-like [Microcaecilia unicolor]|uniref:Adenosine receptor A2b-like n=1 Tax=Microcaecilia unicolor TaxID=1415580 RepID=A0A6P7YYL0_9AMPH|nr:adenosine receptor A2b-like [Microcaecilia unicolor]